MDSQQQQPQQPPPGITLEEIVVWITDHRNLILGVIAAIGVAGLVYVVRDSSEKGKMHRASAALFKLQEEVSLTNEPSASAYEGLRAVTDGTGIAQHVKLREATTLYSAGNYSEAQTAFESFLTTYPDSPLRPEASLGVATSLEAQGKSDEALARYQELATQFSRSSLVDRAKLSQARLFEQKGDDQQAFRIYQELAQRSSGAMGQFSQPSLLQIDAGVAMQRLIKANPALIQTNAPSAESAIAPTTVPMPLSTPGS